MPRTLGDLVGRSKLFHCKGSAALRQFNLTHKKGLKSKKMFHMFCVKQMFVQCSVHRKPDMIAFGQVKKRSNKEVWICVCNMQFNI